RPGPEPADDDPAHVPTGAGAEPGDHDPGHPLPGPEPERGDPDPRQLLHRLDAEPHLDPAHVAPADERHPQGQSIDVAVPAFVRAPDGGVDPVRPPESRIPVVEPYPGPLAGVADAQSGPV